MARERVEDTEAAVHQEQEDMKHAKIARLTNRELDKTFDKMMVAVGDSLSNLESSDKGEVGDVQDDVETEQGKLSEDDEPGWEISTITKMVQQRIERFWQKQMQLDALRQPRWEDAADYFRERNKKYGTSELTVPAILQPPTDDDASATSPTIFEEHMECREIVPGISLML